MPMEANLHPFTIEQLTTSERLIPEKIAEINNDVEAGERRRLEVLLDDALEVARNVAEKTNEKFAFTGSIAMYALLNEMQQENPDVGELMLLEQRISGGKNDFDVCIPLGKKAQVMREFEWNEERTSKGRGHVGSGRQMVDLMERTETDEFPWQSVSLNGETILVQSPEELIFSKVHLLVRPGVDEEGKPREREIKWGVDIKILKAYLMVKKDMSIEELDAYLAGKYEIYLESERYSTVKQLAESFEKTGNAEATLTPVLEQMLGRPVSDLRADLLTTVGGGSEEMVDQLHGARDRGEFERALRGVVDLREGERLTFTQAQEEAGIQYAKTFVEHTETIPKEKFKQQIEAMGEIERIAVGLGITAYQWGGWAADLVKGEPTREHSDLDYLCLVDRPEAINDLENALIEAGWTTKVASGVLVADKGRAESGFIMAKRQGDEIALERKGSVGQIRFPAEWLPVEPVTFQGVTTHVADIRFSYAMKWLPYKYVENLRWREKDKRDIQQMETILAEMAKSDPTHEPDAVRERVVADPSIFETK